MRRIAAVTICGLLLVASGCAGGTAPGAPAPVPGQVALTETAAPGRPAPPVAMPADTSHPPIGAAGVASLHFAPLRFEPPRAERFTLSNGIRVFLLEDHTLPLVELQARFRGGSVQFDRAHFAAAVAVAGLLRTGGTASLPPDSVDQLVDYYALGISFGSGGTSAFSSVDALTRSFPRGVALWADMVRRPRFDPARVEVWREQELEAVRRRRDEPAFDAAVQFNRILFGDHPIGWVLGAEDLRPEDLSAAPLREVHRAIYCPDHLIIGVSGDITASEAKRLLEGALGDWAPCPEKLPEMPRAHIRDRRGVFVIPRDLDQSTVYLGEPGGLVQSDDPDYFASRIANAILGASGFSSRLMQQVRVEKGYAYGVSSYWSVPRKRQGVFGATTRTKPESTIAAIRLIERVMTKMREEAPTTEEVSTAVNDIANGFVFNFETAAQIVGRQMVYAAEDLPGDWLERYLAGIQAVRPADVLRVMDRYVHPEDLTILIVGDTTRLDEPPSSLGPVTVLPDSAR